MPVQFVLDLWRTQWQLYRSFSEEFRFTLPLSFHQCSKLVVIVLKLLLPERQRPEARQLSKGKPVLFLAL